MLTSETNICVFYTPRFCFLLSLSWKGAVFLLIEAGRMAMACTCTGSEIPLSTFYHDGLDGGVSLFFLQQGKQDKDKMSMGFDTCLQIREEDMALATAHEASLYIAHIRLLREDGTSHKKMHLPIIQ